MLIAAKPWGPLISKGRLLPGDAPDCFFFHPSGPSKWPPPESSTLCKPRKRDDFCAPDAQDFASSSTGHVIAIGQFCGRVRPPVEIALWKPGRAMTTVTLPMPTSKNPGDMRADHGHLLSVRDDVYAVAIEHRGDPKHPRHRTAIHPMAARQRVVAERLRDIQSRL